MSAPPVSDAAPPHPVDRKGKFLVVSTDSIAEAARRLLGMATITRADMSTVKDKTVVIWTTVTVAGAETMRAMAREAEEAGAKAILAVMPKDGDEMGFGITKADELKWTGKQVAAYASARMVKLTPEDYREPEYEPEPEPQYAKVTPIRSVPNTGVQEYLAHCMLDDKNEPKPKLVTNIEAALTYHPVFKGMFRFNAFTDKKEIWCKPPWAGSGGWQVRPVADDDIVKIHGWLEKLGLQPRLNELGKIVSSVCADHTYDPAVEYLESLVWDGISRVQGDPEGLAPWLVEYVGVAPTDSGIERAFGMRWLIAGAARVLSTKPGGEKVDTMLILEGPQGAMKSTVFKLLATWDGVEYFTSSIIDTHSKDAILGLQGRVIVEFAELDAMRKSDLSTTKKFLSESTDQIRRPYGKEHVTLRRRCIIGGTVNPSGTNYLMDSTGGRRFWPVKVTGKIELARLAKDREQLWAEAVHLYRKGEPWWLQGDEVSVAHGIQRERYEEDVWAPQIEAFLADKNRVTIADILQNALGVLIDKQTPALKTRVSTHLTHLGWENKVGKVDGKSSRQYRRPGT